MKIINHEANGLQVSQRLEDGYLNLTLMAKTNGKLIADYLRLDTTKAFLDKLSTVMGIPISGKNGLIQIRKGGNDKNAQGTWGHPKVAIHCAMWCDAEFAVFVTNLVFDWMTTGKNPIQPQPTSTEIPTDLSLIVQELENLIISIRSHSRTIHTGAHQPVDPILFKSLHTLSHNQLGAINAAIQHLEMLKRIAEMNSQTEPTPTDNQPTINYLFPSPPLTKRGERRQTTTPQLTNINIKIPSSQRQWLADTARLVRQNNTKPVPPAQRVYPQHLVGIAIQLLQNTSIDIEAAHSLRLEQNEPPATINIKISRQQQQWLTDTAQTIRHNSQQPTTPNERIYPQHLISIAIELLQNAGVNWQRVGNVADIQQGLITAPFQITACLV